MTRNELRILARQGDHRARHLLLFGQPVTPSSDELLTALRLILRNLETHSVVLPATIETLARLDERATLAEDLSANQG